MMAASLRCSSALIFALFQIPACGGTQSWQN
jgi:hypothetical protein